MCCRWVPSMTAVSVDASAQGWVQKDVVVVGYGDHKPQAEGDQTEPGDGPQNGPVSDPQVALDVPESGRITDDLRREDPLL